MSTAKFRFTLVLATALAVLVRVHTACAADCNENGIDDPIDLSTGSSKDCNQNDIPDECDVLKREAAFSEPVNYGVGDGPYAPIAADLDGDGDKDLAAVCAESDEVTVRFNDGTGVFGPRIDYHVGQTPVLCLVAEDLDGDLDLDLATANRDGRSVTLLRNSGDGGFVGWRDLLLPDRAFCADAADLDRDGDQDIAVTAGSNKVYVFWNTGGGTFSAPEAFTVGNFPNEILAVELTGDEFPELVTTNNNGSEHVTVLRNVSDGGVGRRFVLARHYDVGSALGLTAADLNGDGFTDLAGSGLGSSEVWVLFNGGSGTFGPVRTTVVGSAVQSAASADIDHDGDVDLVAAGGSRNVWVLLNQGNGSFEAPIGLSAGSGPTSVSITDVDDLGGPELLVSNFNTDNVSIFFTDLIAPYPDENENGMIDACEYPDFIRGDCDGNGLVAGETTDAIFLLEYNFRGGPAPACLAACDADGDGEVIADLTDAIYLLHYSFLGGPAPELPYPDCGRPTLETDEELGCDAVEFCSSS